MDKVRELDWERDKQLVHDICYQSGSAVTKKSYTFIGSMMHFGVKSMSEVVNDEGFYFVTRGRTHCRLIEIAFKKESQGKGLGKALLNRLLTRMKCENIKKLTFRTPIAENAKDFWLHMGAEITGINGNDFEMEINIK